MLVQAGNAHMSECGLCLTQVCSPDKKQGGEKKLELPLMSSSINFLSHSSEFGSSPDAPALLQQCPNAVGASVVWDRSCLSPGEKTRPDGGGVVTALVHKHNQPRPTQDNRRHLHPWLLFRSLQVFQRSCSRTQGNLLICFLSVFYLSALIFPLSSH